ncbi:VOC family protein [Oceanibacterium hippocampi]|uniref:3-demethylubiquinone-9 3-methyltransferase n=1 Tax=Oceanibacterium hippocampi TaxID=745714 RepID=A0A1Y5TGS2_9PROT|nr:VOC family protein [Oceanibacterium hippocampi]SLN63300.1 3-demethylubiquinone-9 3-methyltransferase [Oceanibacterium hippocampi]
MQGHPGTGKRVETSERIATCLWFDDNAEAAVAFYSEIFPDVEEVGRLHAGEAGPRPAGSVLTITFTLFGRQFVALNGGPDFTFSPAVSHMVICDSQAEIDRYWERLREGGETLQCGWLTDRFGVTWQVVPSALQTMLQDGDSAQCDRVMRAVLTMTKIDIAALEAAYRG